MIGSKMPLTVTCKQDGCKTETRDPCASPPCKRFKQSSIPFQIVIDDDIPADHKENNSLDCISTQETVGKLPSIINNNENPQLDNDEKTISDEAHMESEDTSNITTTPTTNSDPENFEANDQILANIVSSEANIIEINNKPIINKIDDATKAIEKKSGILKFTQPITTESQQWKDNPVTPSKNGHDSTKTPSTPNNSPPSPNTPRSTSPESNSTKPKFQTPKSQTPGRKLSMEEKLKREEEREKKQKEKEQQQQERLEKKQEKERLKMEKEKERQEMKQKKEQEKAEQLELKRQRDKERQEKKEQEEKERREKLEKKGEEKLKREGEKRKKEDEKTSKNEEKRKKDKEETLKKEKAKNTFASFFIKKETAPTVKKELVKVETKFQPFELKPFMKLASTKPIKPLSEAAKTTLNEILAPKEMMDITDQVATSMSLVQEELQIIKSEIKQEKEINLTDSNVTDENNDDEIMIVDDNSETEIRKKDKKIPIQGVKPKLLQFHDNYRPAYFGTWRKKSLNVSPRAPFKKDKVFIDYEVDSDEEWEEEEPGESLSNSEGEDEDNDEEKDENDGKNDGENDGFFVPHGYLSDDEGVDENQDEEMGCENKQNASQNITEDRMQRQLAKQKQWETEMKRQFKPMKPVAIGCLWDGEVPSILKQLEACCLVPGNIIDVSNDCQETSSPATSASTTTYCNTAMRVPEQAMPALIKLLHGNTNGLNKLIMLFRKQWTLETKKDDTVSESNWEDHCAISKRQLERKIAIIAKKERRSVMPKARWYIHNSVLEKYKMEDILLPSICNSDNNLEQLLPSNKVRCVTPTIKQFTQTAPIPGELHKVENTRHGKSSVTG